MLYLGLGLYVANLMVGVVAQFGGMRFGIAHHVLYALVFGSAILATIVSFHPGLLVTLGALAVFPKARPGTFWHPALAVVGLLGYLAAVFLPTP